MNLNKPRFWDSKTFSFWSIILFPFSLIYLLIIILKKKIYKIKNFNIKIICVGNIYIGGTGKTPLVIKLFSLLKNQYKVAVIKKNHLNQKDEISLLKKYCDVFSENTRELAIDYAAKQNFNLAILDDGFQDIKIKKDLSIICFNSEQGIGNGFILPSGPLREPLRNLKSANLVFINGEKNSNLEKIIKNNNPKVEIFYSNYKITNVEKYKNKNYFIFSGLGNNLNFLYFLQKNNICTIDFKFYPDHYPYSTQEINKLKKYSFNKNLTLLTTEKDFFRIEEKDRDNIEYLEVELEIKNEDKLLKTISLL